MADNDILVCPFCESIIVEDSVLSPDPDICPDCGAEMSSYEPADNSEDSLFSWLPEF